MNPQPIPPLHTPKTAVEVVVWFVTSPYKLDFLITRSSLKYNPLNVWRVWHPAFWVMYWEIAVLAYKQHQQGKWMLWVAWSLGTFVETLFRFEIPDHAKFK